MLISQCPHCNVNHVQTKQQFNQNFHPSTAKTQWFVLRCQNPKCNKLVLAVAAQSGEIKQIYPTGSYELKTTAHIPKEVREDFRESGLCLGAGCFKASMVMSRRVLQRCLKEQGCDQHKLVAAIDHAISQNILRPQFHDIATEIRQYGNLGAHPDDDQLQNVNRDNAQQVLEFARLLIHDLYEVPAAASKLRQAREGT
jgi:uncharacterized protein DUF4145